MNGKDKVMQLPVGSDHEIAGKSLTQDQELAARLAVARTQLQQKNVEVDRLARENYELLKQVLQLQNQIQARDNMETSFKYRIPAHFRLELRDGVTYLVELNSQGHPVIDGNGESSADNDKAEV